jgi:hypothetical protein
VYYHLFNNVFNQKRNGYTIADPDGRMVNKVKVDGKEVKVSRIEG